MVMMKYMHSDHCKFMNTLMAPVYEVLFQKRLPRVLPEMKIMLQLSPKIRVGDWFLSEYNTVISVYRFTHQPYVLPAFLTLSMFSLELIRKRLTAKNEKFISFRKHAYIKFPWVVGPFTVKIKLALPKVEILLREKDSKWRSRSTMILTTSSPIGGNPIKIGHLSMPKWQDWWKNKI